MVDLEVYDSPSKLEGVPEGRGRVFPQIKNTLLRRFAPPPLT